MWLPYERHFYNLNFCSFLHFIPSGAIEVSHMTMCKKDRQTIEEVYTLMFVPTYRLPNKTPSCLDPFLKPIIDDLIDLFINGMYLHILIIQ